MPLRINDINERLKNVSSPSRIAINPKTSKYITASWSWADESQGIVQWTLTNNDTQKPHACVLYRNTYIFGGAFWPIYAANSPPLCPTCTGANGFGVNFLNGGEPIPTLVDNGAASNAPPLGLLDFGTEGQQVLPTKLDEMVLTELMAFGTESQRYLVAFIFNLAPGQTWSMYEGGFSTTFPPSGIAVYDVTPESPGNYCVGYDPTRVSDWDSQTNTKLQGYEPNPMTFNTYAFTLDPTTPYNNLGFKDPICAGDCSSTSNCTPSSGGSGGGSGGGGSGGSGSGGGSQCAALVMKVLYDLENNATTGQLEQDVLAAIECLLSGFLSSKAKLNLIGAVLLSLEEKNVSSLRKSFEWIYSGLRDIQNKIEENA